MCKIVVLVLYIFVLGVVSVVVSPILVWVGFELCLMFTLAIMYIEKTSIESLFIYYLIQAIRSLIIISRIITTVKVGFILGVLIKFGLIPYFW